MGGRNVMATYLLKDNELYENEVSLYGSSRLGQRTFAPGDRTIGLAADNSKATRLRRQRFYEQSNHLGNVLTVVSDQKLFDTTTSSYKAKVTSAQDYYPFGLEMEGRTMTDASYRYAFNGKEKDTQGLGDQTHYDYGFRIYNPEIARFLSVDPLTSEYSEFGPFNFAGNTPIKYVDLDGLEIYDEAAGKYIDPTGRGAYNHVKDDIYIYARQEGNRIKYYHNLSGKWEQFISDDPKFSPYKHMQTGTGFGLSVHWMPEGKFTKDVKYLSFMGLAYAFSPIYAAFGVEAGIINRGFATNAAWEFGSSLTFNGDLSSVDGADILLGSLGFSFWADAALSSTIDLNSNGLQTVFGIGDQKNYSDVGMDFFFSGIGEGVGRGLKYFNPTSGQISSIAGQLNDMKSEAIGLEIDNAIKNMNRVLNGGAAQSMKAGYSKRLSFLISQGGDLSNQLDPLHKQLDFENSASTIYGLFIENYLKSLSSDKK